MKCQRCGSERVFDIRAKCGDKCSVMIRGREIVDYPPSVQGICGGDYVFPQICLECGQAQGEFPKPELNMEG